MPKGFVPREMLPPKKQQQLKDIICRKLAEIKGIEKCFIKDGCPVEGVVVVEEHRNLNLIASQCDGIFRNCNNWGISLSPLEILYPSQFAEATYTKKGYRCVYARQPPVPAPPKFPQALQPSPE